MNVVVPGPTDTPGLRGLAPNDAAADAMAENFNRKIPLGRLARPTEVAEAVLFLASARSFTTGSELFVDGGAANL